MEFSEVIRNRRSTRSFSDKPVPKEVLMDIVREAQRTPSWVNSQPWKVYVATGETTKRLDVAHRRLAQMGVQEPTEWEPMSRIQWHLDAQKNMEEWLGDIQNATGGEDFGLLQPVQFHAPVYVFLTIPKAAPIYAAYDLGAFSQSLLLSAQNKGVDSIPAYELIRFPSLVRREMGIPSDEILAMGIALGYRDSHPLNDFVSDRVAIDKILQIKD